MQKQQLQVKQLGEYTVFSDGTVLGRYRRKIKAFGVVKSYNRCYKKDVKKLVVSFHFPTGVKQMQLAQLIAKLFIPNPQNLPHVKHKDGNYKNCSVDNLEWYNGNIKENRYKMCPTKITAYIKKIDRKKLNDVDALVYDLHKGKVAGFRKFMNEEKRYFIAIAMNQYNSMCDKKCSFTQAEDFFYTLCDNLESLCLRGYYLPMITAKKNYRERFIIYAREHLKGMVKGFFRQLSKTRVISIDSKSKLLKKIV